MSRRTPPAAPVMAPIRTITAPDRVLPSAMRAPLTVKKASPSASAIRSRSSGGRRKRVRSTVKAAAAAITPSMPGRATQNTGVRPSSRSRSVPPPTAVTTATTSTPIQSRRRRPAASAPLIANTPTPA